MSEPRLAGQLLRPDAATLARPASAPEAQRILDTLDASAAIAGGTALQLGWPEGVAPATVLVDVSRLPGARGLTWPDDETAPAVRIGCATTLAALARDASLRFALPLLAQAVDAIGAPGVRTLATLGGNLGWRHGDTVAALLVLDASVELAHGDWMRVADWLAHPRPPLAVAVHIPLGHGPGWFEKVGGREAFSPSRLTIAACGGRLAAVAADLPGRRLRAAERWIGEGGGDPGELLDALADDLARVAGDTPGTPARTGATVDPRVRSAAHLILARMPR